MKVYHLSYKLVEFWPYYSYHIQRRVNVGTKHSLWSK